MTRWLRLGSVSAAAGAVVAVMFTLLDGRRPLPALALHTLVQNSVIPAKFLRIHRAALLNLDFVAEVQPWPGGRLLVRLKDDLRTSHLGVALRKGKAEPDHA